MKTYKTKKGYYYKEYKNNNKKRISKIEYIKLNNNTYIGGSLSPINKLITTYKSNYSYIYTIKSNDIELTLTENTKNNEVGKVFSNFTNDPIYGKIIYIAMVGIQPPYQNKGFCKLMLYYFIELVEKKFPKIKIFKLFNAGHNKSFKCFIDIFTYYNYSIFRRNSNENNETYLNKQYFTHSLSNNNKAIGIYFRRK